MEEIRKRLKENRPNLSESSLKTYISFISSLYKKMTEKNKVLPSVVEFFCKNHEKAILFLKDVEPKKRRVIMASLVSLTSHKEDCANHYRKQMTEDNDKAREEEKDQKMTEKQRENWIDWDEVLKIHSQLGKEALPYLSKEKLTRQEFTKLQDYILLSLYTMTEAPRRSDDFSSMKIRNIDKKTDNYIDGKNFIFNKYKTSKHYGQQKLPISQKLKLLLNKWIKVNPSNYLLTTGTGNRLTPVQMNIRFNKIFGKKFSTSMLRHSFLTKKYANVPAIRDMEETAEAMGHSVDEALTTYVKKK